MTVQPFPTPHYRHAIVLDIDDTLYLERDYVASGFRAVGRYVASTRGVSRFADVAALHFAMGRRGDIFDRTLATLGMADDPMLIGDLVALYRAHDPEISLERDATRFLRRFPRDCGLAILSDGFLIAQRAKIAALDLPAARFDRIILTDVYGREGWKPNPCGFVEIQDHFGLPATQIVYIADNPQKDFLAPQALGWRTIRMRRPGGLHRDLRCTPAVDLEIEHFDMLDGAALEGLFATIRQAPATQNDDRPENRETRGPPGRIA